MRASCSNSNNLLIITSNRTVQSASIDWEIFPCFIIMSCCCTQGLFYLTSVIWLFSESSWPVKPSATVLRTAIKIKHLLMLILCISESVWAAGRLWVTHTHTHTHTHAHTHACARSGLCQHDEGPLRPAGLRVAWNPSSGPKVLPSHLQPETSRVFLSLWRQRQEFNAPL